MQGVENQSGCDLQETAVAGASARAVSQLVAGAGASLLDEIDIDSIAVFAQVWLVPVRPVVIHLKLEVVLASQLACPASENVSAREVRVAVDITRESGIVVTEAHAFAIFLFVKIALDGERVSAS